MRGEKSFAYFFRLLSFSFRMTFLPFWRSSCSGSRHSRLITLEDLEASERRIIHHITMKISELEAKLTSYEAKLTKIQTEVQALKDSINGDPDVPQAVIDSVARLDGLLTAVDDINPDAPTNPGPVITPPPTP